jgi:sugar phosphate isomerase/epimerase
MRSAITICLVPEARQGPFVFHYDAGLAGLTEGCRAAAEFGFDAVEIFPGSADDVSADALRQLVAAHGLSVAAVGTGAGWVKHRLQLCDPDASVRVRAAEFIATIINVAGDLGAPAIIGSMQGRTGEGVSHDTALAMLADALGTLGDRARRHGQPLLYEPLNRYETDLFNAQQEAAEYLGRHGLDGVKLLCDLFHMNIEEADMAAALAAVGERVGHVHWADSNRRAIGMGHTDPRPIVAALQSIGYPGFLSAEIFPLPTPAEAARQSIQSIRMFAS